LDGWGLVSLVCLKKDQPFQKYSYFLISEGITLRAGATEAHLGSKTMKDLCYGKIPFSTLL
jgi:hypothetical protein